MSTKVISKSNKNRRPASYIKVNGERIVRKEGASGAWKQIVELEEVGKNKKGKTIYSSKTKHIRA